MSNDKVRAASYLVLPVSKRNKERPKIGGGVKGVSLFVCRVIAAAFGSWLLATETCMQCALN